MQQPQKSSLFRLSSDTLVALTQFLTFRDVAAVAASSQPLRKLTTLNLQGMQQFYCATFIKQCTGTPSLALSRRESVYLCGCCPFNTATILRLLDKIAVLRSFAMQHNAQPVDASVISALIGKANRSLRVLDVTAAPDATLPRSLLRHLLINAPNLRKLRLEAEAQPGDLHFMLP